jgi:hypothetical protein
MDELQEKTGGTFLQGLKRNNKQIREDRAEQIHEITKLKYKRQVEDLQLKITNIKRDRDAALDIAPSNTQTIMSASDFNEDQFIQMDLDYGVKIRENEIKLEIATERYKTLFGGTV